MIDILGGTARQPLVTHRVVEDHAENRERLVNCASAWLHPACALHCASLCQTGSRFQQTRGERLLNRVGNLCAQLIAETFNVGYANQAELALTEIRDEIATDELLVAASRGGSNPNLTLEPARR